MVSLCVTLIQYIKYDLHPSNSLQDIRQNHWTMKYMSLTQICLMRSTFVSHWSIIPNIIFLHLQDIKPFMVMVARPPKKRKPEKSCYYQTLLEFISLLDVSSIFCIFIYYTLILASAWSGFGRSCSVARGRWARLLGNIFRLHLFLLMQNKRYFILSPLSRAAQCICSGFWSFGGKIRLYHSMADSEKGALPTV